MNNHKKTKHPELLEGQPKRGRGRPRKYPPKTIGDFESTKYDVFFNNPPRNAEEGKSIIVHNVVNQVFDFLYKGPNADKLFSHPQTWEENPILKNNSKELAMKFFMSISIISRIKRMKPISHS